jgi:predicted branched-subunit amino acid permease
VGIAYGVAARGSGLSLGETQLMSLAVFSAAAQLSAVSLLGAGAPALVLVGTALALNAQVLLYGLAAGRLLRPSPAGRLVAAFFLTDGAFGIAVAAGGLTLPGLLGAGLSMFVAWNAGTGIGAIAGHALADPHRLGLDFIAPLTFLAVLVPLVRTRAVALASFGAGAATLLLVCLLPGGLAVLAGGLAGSAVGAWWVRRADSAPRADGGAR